ncbi:MAG TPA: hypothetical protein VM890_06625 [Longimicrobium sp.]|nr:hypothetical protein [Longimicrobium sp.]
MAAAPRPPALRVEVRLREWAIDVADSLPAGPITFVVRDAGHDDHALRIHGNGVDAATRALEPDLATTLTVTLAPGRYELECPVKEPEENEDHAALGMRRSLLVVPR